MTTAMRSALVTFGLILLAACGGGSDSNPPPVTSSFDGSWVVCRNDGGPGSTDYRELFTITGTSVSGNTIDYVTTDASCDGDGSTGTPVPLTAVLGGQVSAGLGAGTVMATKVDLTLPLIPPETFYTLVYRDTGASPDALHLGDDSGAYDGSTAALRPVSLQSLARALQTAPVAGDLTGEWRFCPAAEGEILTLNASTGAFDLRKFSGTCGVGTLVEQISGTYTLTTPVYASLGGTTVTAFAVNLAITTPAAVNIYQTLWVDTEASPRRLYHGDDTIHGMDGSTASLRPRVLWPDVYLKQ
jgi:hypothetical protein